MDTQRGSQKMCSSCSWCTVKVWIWVADSCPQRPILNCKNNQTGEKPFSSSSFSSPHVFQFAPLCNIQLCDDSAPPIPFWQGFSPQRQTFAYWFVGSDIWSRSCPGNGRCTLPEWMTVGSLENPVKVSSTFFPEMRTLDLSKAFSETPGPLVPFPLRLWNRNLRVVRWCVVWEPESRMGWL